MFDFNTQRYESAGVLLNKQYTTEPIESLSPPWIDLAERLKRQQSGGILRMVVLEDELIVQGEGRRQCGGRRVTNQATVRFAQLLDAVEESVALVRFFFFFNNWNG